MEALYQRHRPKTLKEIIGQDKAVKILEGYIEKDNIPHALMFSGPSGTGKTTLALILKDLLDCGTWDGNFTKLNSADYRGIDVVRGIRDSKMIPPLGAKSRIWLIEESHGLTKDAQNAFLEILEFPPPYAYFILTTTEPSKHLRTVRTRCAEIKLNLLSEKELEQLLNHVLKEEKNSVSEEVIDKIILASEGSARKALVILEEIVSLPEIDQLEAIERCYPEYQSCELARILLNPRATWSEVRIVLKNIQDEPESIRRAVLGYMGKVILNGGKQSERAFHIITAFRDSWESCSGAGLVAACYEIIVNQ
jgi:DNA polymerase III gamma/tau subunit